ncbi:tRNA 5-methylaminomethyl-2-thiouridine biosynthesis bifunctional protein MnmC [Kordia antarctica]|uniref:tRNA 5-methylaminomethyl-2-thiouridine biosynthesis bifunctional protein MnmC n=1 Tax=Kordia antarctica TaxID=1218801 RepID=A0A7L4ZL45_9FLAO|nr:FAD-binding oxidoreductase [Kordia antarctica]QHI36946.1 tRNA 5-methylaminomethyl-2-thiouridine biosynthesis bifunctional protein MnmC [Kordia antarctica]
MVDYIIVGLGLAGIAFCEELEADGKTFIVYEDNSQQSSTVAGGLYNPVILKRFTLTWNADEQLAIALPFYNALEQKLGVKFDEKLAVMRRFTAVEEQNMWFEASDKPKLSKYLDTKLVVNTNKSLNAPFSLGRVKKTGRINTKKLLKAYREYLESENVLRKERFQYIDLIMDENSVRYQNIKAKKIIFCEGFGVNLNPYFSYLPLKGSKGELLMIKAPNLNLDYVSKSSVFLIPQGNDIYSVGATYDWKDKTHAITEEAKAELVEKLSKLINCDYEIIDQVAGIRPTVVDRRPLVGIHPNHSQIAILNGLGTRGVMIGPTVAKQLYNHLTHQAALPTEIDIKRFEHMQPKVSNNKIN